MAEETTSQNTTEAAEAASEAQPATQEPANTDAIVEADGAESQNDSLFEPLFDSESISEAALRGDEDGNAEPTSETSEAKNADTPPAKEKDDGAEKPPDQTDEQAKPPKGFVPIQALHQERGQRQLLSQEVQQLRAKLDAFRSGQKTVERDSEGGDEGKADGNDDFRVLSEEEFNDLLEEDPVEAIKYDRKLRTWESQQAQQQKAVQAERELVERSVGMMAEAIPGLYDQDSDVNEKLSQFAIEKGFTDTNGLALVTDPRTKVIPANGGQPMLLGEAAAQLVLMLNNYFQDANGGNAKDNKAAVEKIRADVTKEVLSKLKTSDTQHMSLGDVPGDSGDISTPPKILNETDFAKLSEEEQRRLLGG